jgi:hypothetical protein
MSLLRHKIAGQYYNTKSANKSVGNVASFYVSTVTKVRTKFTIMFKAGLNLVMLVITACNLSVVLYGCETWPFTLREEYRQKVVKTRC